MKQRKARTKCFLNFCHLDRDTLFRLLQNPYLYEKNLQNIYTEESWNKMTAKISLDVVGTVAHNFPKTNKKIKNRGSLMPIILISPPPYLSSPCLDPIIKYLFHLPCTIQGVGGIVWSFYKWKFAGAGKKKTMGPGNFWEEKGDSWEIL